MTDAIEQRKSALKWAYAWIMIMLAVNFFYVGYSLTNEDTSGLSEVSLYNMFYASQGTTQTNLDTIDASTEGYSPEDINTNEGGFLSFILDALDTIFNYAKFITFMVTLLTLGGAFISWDILTGGIITNIWMRLILVTFMSIGNLVFILLMYRLIINKGRED